MFSNNDSIDVLKSLGAQGITVFYVPKTELGILSRYRPLYCENSAILLIEPCFQTSDLDT